MVTEELSARQNNPARLRAVRSVTGNRQLVTGNRKPDSGLRFSPLLIRAGSILFCLLAWQFASTYKWNFLVNFENIPSPSAVAAAAANLVQSPKFQNHLISSVSRVLFGFGCASILAIIIGVLAGHVKQVRDAVMPPLELLRPIPAVAWIPVAVLMFPNPEESMIYITFVGAFYPILLSTIHGVTSVEPKLIVASLTLGASNARVFSDVIVPAAMPSIVTGLTIGMGNAWFSLVTAEMVAGQFGIGYFTWESYTLQKYDDIVLGMVTIGVLGMLSSLAIRKAFLHFIPWAAEEVGA